MGIDVNMGEIEVSFDQKVDQFIEGMKKYKRKCLEHLYFEDSENQYRWYLKEGKKLMDEYQQQKELSQERIEQIHSFSRIDYYYHEFIESRKLPFSVKAKEYKKEVLRLRRRVRESDHLTFSNEDKMHPWLYTQNNNMEIDLSSKRNLSEKRKKEIEALKKINDLIKQFPTIRRLTFLEKASEYRTKLYEIGRKITIEDEFLFSDGSKMNTWFTNQLADYRKYYKRYPYKYKKRFEVLLDIYTCVESLGEETKKSKNEKIKK